MISIRVNDINHFMQHLLTKDTLDRFIFYEGQISTASTFELDGRINREFFDSEELASLPDEFVSWHKIKTVCFEIIKGKKVPTKMKLVLGLSQTHYEEILNQCGVNHSPSDIGGLYLHIHYEQGEIQIITGSTLNIFTMDKSLDKHWDGMIQTFLSKQFDIDIE